MNRSVSGRIRAPFFVIGAPRSGTTMLRMMLNRHPELAIPPESHFLVPLMRQLPRQGILNTDQVRSAVGIIAHCPRFLSWKTTAEELRAAAMRLSTPTLQAVVDEAFQLETGHTGRPRWGDKTPLYASYVRELDQLFPQAQFIHIVRDGRDVSLSLKNLAWSGWTEYERARFWARVVEKAEASGAQIGSSRYLRVFYEDLVLDPEVSIGRLCSFLDIPFSRDMLSFHEDALSHITAPERKTGVHDKLARPPRKTDVARWRKESTPLSILLFEANAGRTMDLLGIPRHFSGALRGTTAVGRLIYTPIGASVGFVHQLFDRLPESLQSSFRNNPCLRWIKRAVIRW